MANDTTPPVSSGFETLFPDASALASECARSLVFTADLILGRIARLLRPFDVSRATVSPASGLVLSILGDSEEPLAPHEIAERLIVSRATVTGLIDSLESRESQPGQRASQPKASDPEDAGSTGVPSG